MYVKFIWKIYIFWYKIFLNIIILGKIFISNFRKILWFTFLWSSIKIEILEFGIFYMFNLSINFIWSFFSILNFLKISDAAEWKIPRNETKMKHACSLSISSLVLSKFDFDFKWKRKFNLLKALSALRACDTWEKWQVHVNNLVQFLHVSGQNT